MDRLRKAMNAAAAGCELRDIDHPQVVTRGTQGFLDDCVVGAGHNAPIAQRQDVAT